MFILLLLVVGCDNTQEVMTEEMPEDFNFSLTYGTYGKQKIDTFRDIVVKDLIADGTIKANIALTKKEKQAIYNEMRKINIMGDLNLDETKECHLEPPSETKWRIHMNGKTKKFSYKAFCDYPQNILNLIELERFIDELVSKKKEYLDLPERNGGYL